MNNSIIEHRANYHYIQVCEEYLLICSHGKASPHCKALILSVLEQWTNTKRDMKQPLDSIYMTYPLWEQSLYYLYSRSTIIECLTELEKEKVITRTPHHTPNGKDTFAYGLAVERVQALIKALPDKGVKDLLPRLDAFKNAPRKQAEYSITLTEQKLIKQHLLRAMKAGTPATLTEEEWFKTVTDFNVTCAYCQEKPYQVLEHFIPIEMGGGTTKENCVPACRRCNMTKKGFHPLELPTFFPLGNIEQLRTNIPRVKEYLETRVNLDGTPVQKQTGNASNSERETRVNLNDDASKNRRNVSSSTTSSHKESVVSPTLPQPEITPTLPDVALDYTTSPTIENGQPSMQLSTQQASTVDNSQQSYSHKPATSVPTHVGVMPVLSVPLPPGAKIPDAPRVQAPTPPKNEQGQPSDDARAIRRMYDRCAGYVTGHAAWEWVKMEEMARDLQEAETPPTKEDMQLVYDHLKAMKQKHTIGHVWEAWEQLPTLKAKQVQTSTTPAGIYMPPESDLVRRMREMRESVEKKQVAQ